LLLTFNFELTYRVVSFLIKIYIPAVTQNTKLIERSSAMHSPCPELVRIGLTGAQLEVWDTFRRLWMEHVLWTRFFMVSTAFDLPDLSVVTERLLRNPYDFGNEFYLYFATPIAVRFETLLREHLQIAGLLVNAAKEGNTAEVEKQRRLWYTNAEDIANFLASINPYWCAEVWKDLLFNHLRMTEDEAVQILTGQYEMSIRQFDSIEAQALRMADVMSCGIIKRSGIQ
jgi:hypothetical protein